MIGCRLFPNLETPDQAYPKVVSHLIGPLGYGVRGLVFAALIGVVMSTIAMLFFYLGKEPKQAENAGDDYPDYRTDFPMGDNPYSDYRW